MPRDKGAERANLVAVWLAERHFKIKLGGNFFTNCPVLVAFDRRPLFGVTRSEEGLLGIDFEVFNATGVKIASVKRNNIYCADKDAYQVEGSASYIALRDKTTQVPLVRITKGPDAAPVELEVSVSSYLPDGRILDLGPEVSNYANWFQMDGMTLQDNLVVNIGSIGQPTGIIPTHEVLFD